MRYAIMVFKFHCIIAGDREAMKAMIRVNPWTYLVSENGSFHDPFENEFRDPIDLEKFVLPGKAREALKRGGGFYLTGIDVSGRPFLSFFSGTNREIQTRHGSYALSSEFVVNPVLNDRNFLLQAPRDFRLLKAGMVRSFKSGGTRGGFRGFVRAADSWIINLLPASLSILLQRIAAVRVLPKIFKSPIEIFSICESRIVRLKGG